MVSIAAKQVSKFALKIKKEKKQNMNQSLNLILQSHDRSISEIPLKDMLTKNKREPRQVVVGSDL